MLAKVNESSHLIIEVCDGSGSSKYPPPSTAARNFTTQVNS